MSKIDFYKDLKKSGLSKKDVEACGFEYVTKEEMPDYAVNNAQAKAFSEAGMDGVYIPYYDLNGEYLDYEKTYRIKLLKEHTTPDGKTQKYTQPAKLKPHFYLCPLLPWQSIAENPDNAVYIVEGEKKAAYMCKLGFAAIGIGGVRNYTANGKLIGDFGYFQWHGRDVKILFDSDKKIKPEVLAAEKALADALIGLEACPIIVDLPGPDKGVDDYGVKQGSIVKARKAIAALNQKSLIVPDTGFSVIELMAMELPPIVWTFNNFLPTGLCLLSGAPKIGKSWFCLELCLSKALQMQALGQFQANPGGVLYLALEDTKRRLQDRLRMLLKGRKYPTNMRIEPEWATADQNGLFALRSYLDRNPLTNFVVVDTFAKIRGHINKNSQLYYDDYAAISELKKIADDYAISILVVHHNRKSKDGDYFDQISGSTGLSGSADTVGSLSRVRSAGSMAELRMSGRDLEEKELGLEFEKDTGRWICKGDAQILRVTDTQSTILEELVKSDEPLSPRDLVIRTDINENTIKKALVKMLDVGSVEKVGRGAYSATCNKGDRDRYRNEIVKTGKIAHIKTAKYATDNA